MTFHVIYTLDGKVSDGEFEFDTFSDCEKWLTEIGATRWEIARIK